MAPGEAKFEIAISCAAIQKLPAHFHSLSTKSRIEVHRVYGSSVDGNTEPKLVYYIPRAGTKATTISERWCTKSDIEQMQSALTCSSGCYVKASQKKVSIVVGHIGTHTHTRTFFDPSMLLLLGKDMIC